MTFKNLARLFDRAPLAASLRQYCQSSQAVAALPVQHDVAEQLKWRWSLDTWLQGWQESSWLAMPKKKVCHHYRYTRCRAWKDKKFMVMQVSPHRRGMRNAGKHQKMVPVMSRCKCVCLLDLLHQDASCNSSCTCMHTAFDVMLQVRQVPTFLNQGAGNTKHMCAGSAAKYSQYISWLGAKLKSVLEDFHRQLDS